MQEDRYSYLMMFCALMMVRNSRATLAQSMELLPLSERVSDLAGELAHVPGARGESPSDPGAESVTRPAI